MTWIDGERKRSFEVDAPVDEVARFYSNPEQIKDCMGDLERYEKVDDQTYRWILEEIGAKNITFQGDYTVRYERDGNEVTWKSEGEGTMRTEGRATLREIGEGRTAVEYQEKLASDLPIPKLARRVFKPIVAREIKRGVDGFVDNTIDYLNAGRHRQGGGQ
jgi:carbon monoxide dehydrogenase subunit G